MDRLRGVKILFLLVGLAITGCGAQEPFKYVPIQGRVTYEDGSPVTGGELQFVSEATPQGMNHPRPAMAHISSGGTFDAVTSHKFGDGLIPGKHKVAIVNAMGKEGQSLVPEKYASTATSPIVIDTADAPLVIKVPKP